MRVLVITTVHVPLDARIHRRQITSLRRAGHDVVYAAPFTGYAVDPRDLVDGVTPVDLPRARGRRRLHALLAARRVLRKHGPAADLVLLHDPELLLAAWATPVPTPVVWDVHEDLAASFADKDWVPGPLAGLLERLVEAGERLAERRWALLLAEHGYVGRFRRFHPVVPNLPWLPPAPSVPGVDRVVYLGRVSVLRGGRELLSLGPRLAARGIALEVLGPIDSDLSEPFTAAQSAGHLRAPGFVPNETAVAQLDGALAGLSLLHDHPNYRHSRPTKLLEYAAAGIPSITTPLPEARRFLESSGGGVVVPFEDVDAVEAAVTDLAGAPERARRLGQAGRRYAEHDASWDAVADRFVAELERLADRRQPSP